MKKADLIFQELQPAQADDPRAPGQRQPAGGRARRAWSRTTASSCGRRLDKLENVLSFLHAREDQIETLLHNYGPVRQHPRQHRRQRPLVRRLRPQHHRRLHRRVRPHQAGRWRMTGWSRRAQWIAAAVPVALLLLTFLVYPRAGGSRTVTAHFDRAVAVYPGTHLRVMGVRDRRGHRGRARGQQRSRRDDVRQASTSCRPTPGAAVVTPTLVADRYVQVFPAYSKGAGDARTTPTSRCRARKTPIELDRMFKSLDDLATTLGPKAGSTSGALDNLLSASAKALDGNGELGLQDDPQPVAGGGDVRRQPRPAVRQRPFARQRSPTRWPTTTTRSRRSSRSCPRCPASSRVSATSCATCWPPWRRCSARSRASCTRTGRSSARTSSC